MSDQWQAVASQDICRKRAALLRNIRCFMEERDIMEVETPILSDSGIPDPNIHSLITTVNQSGKRYMHSSPESAMKRLLASGSGPIYQVCKVFRNEECGRFHQPEFTMLEWYRPGFDHLQLMDELSELMQELSLRSSVRNRYAEVFETYTGLNPHTAATENLAHKAFSLGLNTNIVDRSMLLDFLFNHRVSPNLGQQRPQFIYDYPSCQAALARLTKKDPPVAERFELFISGMEIANGYHELTEVKEQKERFDLANAERRRLGLPRMKPDKNLLSALENGLPACAGVAVGLDRLLMVLTGSSSIQEVLVFPYA